MGKTALLVVLGTSLVLGNMLAGLNKRTASQSEFISEHYERMISRNIANNADFPMMHLFCYGNPNPLLLSYQ